MWVNAVLVVFDIVQERLVDDTDSEKIQWGLIMRVERLENGTSQVSRS